ncbi:SDR family NAD(P)-dependent oxidoreductase [Kribbella sp. CA-293567]|uniref:SDR family NAD(P)-dependent oxidoreductase n=1 Tax=Kribbella sp. CA-293567 TaxID=3002436 RepID=UPI0022DDF573|nr:SDR family NAD(P)-dependent oxidoreductase [Kribbella sp. CA-293567]WBQ05718.1 SDR family NAD(P)-dependent oxidoreductase [Kribbella sp. CA-293567]
MRNLIWISGASSGIGAALAASTPYAEARVIDLSRRGGVVEHFAADLADPADWQRVEEHFVAELAGFDGERVIFVHNAGTVVPIGPAATVDPAAYTQAVLLNSAAPQVLGRAFLRATARLDCEKHLVMLSSGAASKAYPGWSAYNAGKAAVEHWVRTVGLEEVAEGKESGGSVKGCRVVAVAPGVVDTAMQGEIRAVDEQDFPAVERFRELKRSGGLTTPEEAAAGLWAVIAAQYPTGSVLDLRELPS